MNTRLRLAQKYKEKFGMVAAAFHPRKWLVVSVLSCSMLFSFTACKHKTNAEDEGATCARRHEENICPDGQVYRKGECTVARCDVVENGGNCCPGMSCLSSGECKIAASSITKCTDSAGCPDGQMCLDRPLVADGSKTCGFPPVDNNGACPDGSQYFAGRCVMRAPCDGFCNIGEVCNIETNSCEPVPYIPGDVEASGCSKSCSTGELLVYEDPDTMLFDHCCEVRCRCEVLPSLTTGVIGRFADMALSSKYIYVSSYDDTYGDLVINLYDRENGALLLTEYVDGVPESGNLVGSPNGIRNGFAEPGPNVGQYTAIVVKDELPAVAYYDLDNHAVKFARFDGSSIWHISTVDNGQPAADKPAADTGRYIDLFIGEDNLPQISYLMVRGMLDGADKQVTGLVYAKAKKAIPTGKSDWNFYLVDSKPVPSVACNGNCPDNQTCVKIDAATVCRANNSGCSGCRSDETCVLEGGAPKCLPKVSMPAIATVLKGVGLYSNIINVNTIPHIVYHDSIDGTLKVATAEVTVVDDVQQITGFKAPIILDGSSQSISINNGGTTNDVGRFASALMAPDGKLHVSYLDGNENLLRHFYGILPSEGYVEIADDGVRDDGRHYVGADSSMVITSDPSPVIAYQDSTNLDLVVSRQKDGYWYRDVVSPCGDLCVSDADVCVAGYKGLPTCMAKGSKLSDCYTSCADNEECVKVADSGFECRRIKDDISNGFFVKMILDKNLNKAYITDLEVGFDSFQHRSNILGVRILDATNW